jgi:hypothetical protein
MSGVFKIMGDWIKKLFFAATALAVAALNLLMLMDVFQANILFVILGMVFFSIATWVYLITAFSAKEDSKRSGAQMGIAWAGLGISLIGELSMATFEILRMQAFITVPEWISTVTIIVIEAAVILHLLLGIAYFAAGQEYNEQLARIFENSRRRAADEKMRAAQAANEIHVLEEATNKGVDLTRSMLEAALPVVAERKARLMAGEIAKTFGMDADLQLNRAFDRAIKEYRATYNTRALAGYGVVVDGEAHDVTAEQPAVTKRRAPAVIYAPEPAENQPDPTGRRKAESSK